MSRITFYLLIGLIFCLGIIQSDNTSQFQAFEATEIQLKRVNLEFQKILANAKYIDLLKTNETWNYIDTGYTYNAYITLKEFTFNGTTFDPTKLTSELKEDTKNIIVSSPEGFTVRYNFNYNAKTGVVSSTLGQGYLLFSAKNVVFTKQEVLPQDGIHTEVSKVSFDISLIGEITSGSMSDTLASYFTTVRNNSFTDVFKKSFLEVMQNQANDYYDKDARSKPATLVVETSNPTYQYDVGYQFIDNPLYKLAGITYYYSGDVKKRDSVKFLSKNTNYEFDPTKGTFQIHVSHSIIRSIIKDISDAGTFFFNLRPSTVSAAVKDFKMNVQYLGQIIPGILAIKPRDEKIYVSGNVRDVVLEEQNSKIGTCNVIFEVVDGNGVTLLKFTSSFKFELEAYYDMVEGWNYSLKTVNLIDTTITQNIFGKSNTIQLNTWIQDSLNSYAADDDSWGIFRKSIDLKSLFKNIQIFEDDSQGILMAGDPAEAPLLKQDIRSNILRLLKESI